MRESTQVTLEALGHIALIQAPKNRHDKHSEFFKKRVYNLRELDR